MLRNVSAALLTALFVSCSGDEPAPRTVALVTFDTLRVDYVHAYGFPQPITPQLDRLAARGVVFERAIATASSTIPSHASMMTGLYPRQQSTGARNGDTRLVDRTTLAERFGEAGWRTGAFVSNVVLQRRSGLDRGFAHYDERLPTSEPRRRSFERLAPDAVDAAVAWLAEQGDAPVFLWVHLQDPHGPYTPPAEWLDRVEPVELPEGRDVELDPSGGDRAAGALPRYQALDGVRRASEYARRYAAEIAYADAALGHLLTALETRGPHVVLATADHGESLGEGGHYLQHGHASTAELARVPFILAAPGLRPGRRGEVVSGVDVAPTLLELAGQPAIDEARGIALGPWLREGRPLPDRTVFCDAVGESSAYRLNAFVRLTGFTDSTAAQAIARATAGAPTALRVAGRRQRPDGGWEDRVAPALVRELRDYLRAEVPVAAASLEPATLERLQALGYLTEVDAPESAGASPPADSDPEAAP